MRCQNKAVLTSYIIGEDPDNIVNIFQHFEIKTKNWNQPKVIMDDDVSKNGRTGE